MGRRESTAGAARSAHQPPLQRRVLPSNSMLAHPQFGTAAYGTAAFLAWGTSDFLGGYASRRINAFLFTAIFNLGGMVLVGSAAVLSGAAFPSQRAALWLIAGGISGSAGVAVFFRALSTGRMGLIAPISAVLGAAILVVVAIFTEGFPGKLAMAGFTLAVIGLWLITRAEDGHTPEGIGLAVAAGIGFAGFYLCSRQAGNGSVLWFATLSRAGGLIVTAAIVLWQGTLRDISFPAVRWATVTGGIDSCGTMFFLLASQAGRLDEAVVIASLYPAITVLLARIFLKEHFTRWKLVGLLAALAAVPLIAAG